jgi:hypothetical protein
MCHHTKTRFFAIDSDQGVWLGSRLREFPFLEPLPKQPGVSVGHSFRRNILKNWAFEARPRPGAVNLFVEALGLGVVSRDSLPRHGQNA